MNQYQHQIKRSPEGDWENYGEPVDMVLIDGKYVIPSVAIPEGTFSMRVVEIRTGEKTYLDNIKIPEMPKKKVWKCRNCNMKFVPEPPEYRCPHCQSSATSPTAEMSEAKREARRQGSSALPLSLVLIFLGLFIPFIGIWMVIIGVIILVAKWAQNN